jgi:ubiquitin conjugation factor E4 B
VHVFDKRTPLHLLSSRSPHLPIALVVLSFRTAPLDACRSDILDRIVQFVNGFISKVSPAPRRAALVVTDSGALFFAPEEWLHLFIDLYLQLSNASSTFVECMAAESASFESEHLFAAGEILRGNGALTPSAHAALIELVQTGRACLASSESALADLGEIPDEFLDPLLSTLMRDPLRLPSGVSIDRAVITRHLLNKPSDPFNRASLTIEQCVPDTELLQRIHAFVAERERMKQRQ